jgi:hypothetical protein
MLKVRGYLATDAEAHREPRSSRLQGSAAEVLP